MEKGSPFLCKRGIGTCLQHKTERLPKFKGCPGHRIKCKQLYLREDLPSWGIVFVVAPQGAA